VLANSWKHHDYCIAGIDLATGKWVRPVTKLNDGRVPLVEMKLKGRIPALLDIIDIPLDTSGPDFGFESENRWILPGEWRHVSVETPETVSRYVSQPTQILHSNARTVSPDVLKALPFEKRATLQLVRIENFAVRDSWNLGKRRWSGRLASGGKEFDATISDPVFHAKLNEGHKPASRCFLTLSLSMPFSSSTGAPPVCWKLIAGVIELPST